MSAADAFMFELFKLYSRALMTDQRGRSYFVLSSGTNEFPAPRLYKDIWRMYAATRGTRGSCRARAVPGERPVAGCSPSRPAGLGRPGRGPAIVTAARAAACGSRCASSGRLETVTATSSPGRSLTVGGIALHHVGHPHDSPQDVFSLGSPARVGHRGLGQDDERFLATLVPVWIPPPSERNSEARA